MTSSKHTKTFTNAGKNPKLSTLIGMYSTIKYHMNSNQPYAVCSNGCTVELRSPDIQRYNWKGISLQSSQALTTPSHQRMGQPHPKDHSNPEPTPSIQRCPQDNCICLLPQTFWQWQSRLCHLAMQSSFMSNSVIIKHGANTTQMVGTSVFPSIQLYTPHLCQGYAHHLPLGHHLL